MQVRRVLYAAVALTAFASQSPAATYRVGSGGGCTHAAIQSAIDAAHDNPGADVIRVTRSLTYSDQALTVQDQDLVLEGGYANCTATADNVRSVVNGNGDDSVLKIHGNGDVVLRKLTITGGHEPRTGLGYGGGIEISDGPHLVSVSDLLVIDNDAGHGGGISIRNEVSGNPADMQLILGDNTVISSNEAGFVPTLQFPAGIEGGGIYCEESLVRMTGTGSTSITNNSADHSGGGLGAHECDLVIAPRGVGSFNGIVLNNAGLDGGGLAVAGGSGGGTRVYTAQADRPVYIAGNTAGREGGGIKVESGAVVSAWDLIIDSNRSLDEGGAISIFDSSSTGASFSMRGTLDDAPVGAIDCLPALRCNRISGNVAMDASGAPKQAAALRTKVDDAPDGSVHTDFRGTLFYGNAGLNLYRARVACGLGVALSTTRLTGVAIFGNTASGGQLLLSPDNPLDCSNSLSIDSSSIGGNDISGPDVIGATNDVLVRRTAIWQPGKRAVNIAGLSAGRVRYLMANDITGIPPSADVLALDPRFIDTERGDLHLHPSSPAIDFAPMVTAIEIDAEADEQPRTFDLPLVPNTDGFGPQDIGAYERRVIGNLVRNPDFADDLHIWTDATPAATNWDTNDQAGATNSGSLLIQDNTATMRVVGLRQCVGIPGPGPYVLNGMGFITASTIPILTDRAVLAWTLRRDSVDCTGPNIGGGEEEIGGIGWKAIEPQPISVAAADWTANTTVEVQLVLRKVPLVPTDTTGNASFDRIRLEAGGPDNLFADGFE